jgi:argininosuccinate synthase
MSTGQVTLKLYKGNVMVTGRKATSRCIPTSWSPSRTTRVPTTRSDAAGFIKLNALRLRTLAARNRDK